MDRPYRVLAVCLGNICRSPTAEAAIREAASRAGLDIEVDSAGTGAWHVGEPPDERMTAAARGLGLTLSGLARRFEPIDFERHDLIVAMDRRNYDHLVEMAADETDVAKVRMFRSFDPTADSLEVPDPYYGGQQGFVDVVEMVRRAASGLVESLT
jgi:protein-tyrosine phosphatase